MSLKQNHFDLINIEVKEEDEASFMGHIWALLDPNHHGLHIIRNQIRRERGPILLAKSMMALCGGGRVPMIRATADETSTSLRLSLPKPIWIVRTESNVRKLVRKKPDPPCVICNGTGRHDCYQCRGKGRTNSVDATMLPKGEWPKWCRDCGGSGLGLCSRCLGTGEYRYIMGFQFMKMDSDQNQKNHQQHVNCKSSTYSAADRFLDEESCNSELGLEM